MACARDSTYQGRKFQSLKKFDYTAVEGISRLPLPGRFESNFVFDIRPGTNFAPLTGSPKGWRVGVVGRLPGLWVGVEGRPELSVESTRVLPLPLELNWSESRFLLAK